MDWKTLKTFDFSKKIYRKLEVQKKYENEMNKYINYEKYILNKFLNNKLYNLQPNNIHMIYNQILNIVFLVKFNYK